METPPRKPGSLKLEKENPDAFDATGKSARKPKAQKDMSLISMREPSATDPTTDNGASPSPPMPPVSGLLPWKTIFWGALAGLLSLVGGVIITRLITELFRFQGWLGWSAAGLAFLLFLSLFAIIAREIRSISRLNAITGLRKKARLAQSGEQPSEGFKVTSALEKLYSARPDMANSRVRFEHERADILDGEDLLSLFETVFMGPVDKQAKFLVMQSARRVSMVTAISPRAIIDVGYALMENIRLIRNISYLYGGRPGFLGFWKLVRNILEHLAATGIIAAGDGIIQQFLGHGVAARLSVKLGEGVVNGLLTARIGIAAMDQARPLEFKTLKRPGISEYFSEISSSFTRNGKE